MDQGWELVVIAWPPVTLTHVTADDVRRAGACPDGVRAVLAKLDSPPTSMAVKDAMDLAGEDSGYVSLVAGLSGYGSGYGYGSGSGYGSGYGYGYGYGYGSGDGSGYGSGYG